MQNRQSLHSMDLTERFAGLNINMSKKRSYVPALLEEEALENTS